MNNDRPRRKGDDLDSLLANWPFSYGEVTARQAHGADGRRVMQLRIDLGVLQMETTGRPDGTRPEGHETYLHYLISACQEEGDAFELDSERCSEVDREFVQYYHRRVAWLALRDFDKAVLDADHTLALMNFSTAHAPDEDWVDLHEQYRPFVLFHRTQAQALAELERSDAEAAVLAIDEGLRSVHNALEGLEIDSELSFQLEEDDFVEKLRELRRSILADFDLELSLSEQLADAIAHEQYERAAELRDRIARRRQQSGAPR